MQNQASQKDAKKKRGRPKKEPLKSSQLAARAEKRSSFIKQEPKELPKMHQLKKKAFSALLSEDDENFYDDFPRNFSESNTQPNPRVSASFCFSPSKLERKVRSCRRARPRKRKRSQPRRSSGSRKRLRGTRWTSSRPWRTSPAEASCRAPTSSRRRSRWS